MVGAILACVTNLLFVLLTYHPGSLPHMYVAVIFDNLAAGLASAVFIAFLSALTSIRFYRGTVCYFLLINDVAT
ncbi:hypothetical protein PKHYL_23030 [Psychrobacter sp. KH172YL61]|nr:hypothetical protein PKHYL_23030 [Psychrobacter sp. KH172YL61]